MLGSLVEKSKQNTCAQKKKFWIYLQSLFFVF